MRKTEPNQEDVIYIRPPKSSATQFSRILTLIALLLIISTFTIPVMKLHYIRVYLGQLLNPAWMALIFLPLFAGFIYRGFSTIAGIILFVYILILGSQTTTVSILGFKYTASPHLEAGYFILLLSSILLIVAGLIKK